MRPGFAPTGISNIDPSQVDLTRVQKAWEAQLDALLDAWFGITRDQRRQIEAQVRLAVHSDDVAALAQMSVSTAAAEEALVAAMNDMALRAAEHVVEEARDQGVRIDPVSTDRAMFVPIAAAVTILLAEGLTNSAGREALRRWSRQATGDEVAKAVDEHLGSLSDSFVAANLGGALTTAQNAGRLDTMLAGPTAALYASEQMDTNTCKPCRRINGKWIGNSDDAMIADKVAAIYPNGGYVDCLGGVRCRGTVVSIYRPAGARALIENHPGHADQKSHGRRGGVRGLLNGAKTIGELNAAATAEAKRLTGRDISFDLAGSDLQTAKEHSEGLLRGLERFPNANLQRVEMARLGGSTWAEADGSTIRFNTVFASSAGRDRYDGSLAEGVRGWKEGLQIYGISDRKITGFHVRNSGTPIAVGLHEFGHVVDIATTHERSARAVDELTRKLTTREQRSQTLSGTPVRDPGDYIQRTVSSYGSQNRSELIAESFSDVMLNGSSASQLSQGIFNILESEYNA